MVSCSSTLPNRMKLSLKSTLRVRNSPSKKLKIVSVRLPWLIRWSLSFVVLPTAIRASRSCSTLSLTICQLQQTFLRLRALTRTPRKKKSVVHPMTSLLQPWRLRLLRTRSLVSCASSASILARLRLAQRSITPIRTATSVWEDFSRCTLTTAKI